MEEAASGEALVGKDCPKSQAEEAGAAADAAGRGSSGSDPRVWAEALKKNGRRRAEPRRREPVGRNHFRMFTFPSSWMRAARPRDVSAAAIYRSGLFLLMPAGMTWRLTLPGRFAILDREATEGYEHREPRKV
jgi:hypothetical protein